MKIATTTGDLKILGENHAEQIKIIAEAGFKYIDFCFYNINNNSKFMSAAWKDYAGELKKLCDDLGVKLIQAHAPNTNPLNDEKIDDTLKLTKRSIEVCDIFGISNIVYHAGWLDGIGKDEFFKLNYEFCKELFPLLENYKINLLIENSTKANLGKWHYFFDGKEMEEFIRYVNHPYIHACWDTGHANIEGHQYEDIVALGDNLKALHINDNLGSIDQHIAPFMGTMSIDEVMTALLKINYQGYFTFEADSTLKTANNWLHKRTKFDESTILLDPPVEIFKANEKLLYETGKAILQAYKIFEE